MIGYDVCSRDGYKITTVSSIEKANLLIKQHPLLQLTYQYRDISFIEWLLLKVVFQ